MISPLDIPIMVIAEDVHDVMWTGTSVENVAQDMKRVDSEALYQVAKRNDEVVCTSGADDGVHDDTYVCLFIGQYGAFMQQFLNDV